MEDYKKAVRDYISKGRLGEAVVLIPNCPKAIKGEAEKYCLDLAEAENKLLNGKFGPKRWDLKEYQEFQDRFEKIGRKILELL